MTNVSEDKKYRFLALGDSYTIGEAVPENDCWPMQLVEMLNAAGKPFSKPLISATTGWTTDELMNAIQIENPQGACDLVSLLIGVNNQYRGYSKEIYAKEFENLLNQAIDFADGISFGSETINAEVEKYAKKSGKPILEFKGEAEYADAYNEFYDLILEESTVLTD